MNDRYQEQWERLGAHDPYWAVLTDPRKKGGRWDKEEFFATGREEIEQLLKNLADLGVKYHAGTALDFGCGVGRLCRALSDHFTRVIGVDISQAMLDEARAAHRDIANIEFVYNIAADLGCIPSATIDLVYSNIVLQHMPPAQQLSYINEFARIVRPGGVVVFQTPDRYDLHTLNGWIHLLAGNRILNIARRVIHGKNGVMEVHPLAQRDILAALAAGGMAVREIEQYETTGRGFRSYRYYAMKR
ncbi:MAG: class I SAM-dependent methyltransferase [Desulfobulbus sp.]|nr:MAG: class I SAM-dependent methyltransferase [Desulfobulbus sp.]